MNGRLRQLPFAARLGVMCLVLVIGGGLWASLAHLEDHHQNRDSKPGVSLDDIKGAYHGVKLPAPLAGALERMHPPSISEADRRALTKWLESKNPNELYDEPALGAEAPAEIIARNCVSCHARKSTDGSKIGEKLPLEFWDDVKKVVFPTVIDPVPKPILIASAHAHLLAMATLSVAVMVLLLATRFGKTLKSLMILLLGLGLLVDFLGQWMARDSLPWVFAVIGGGVVYVLGAGLSLVLIAAELWLPDSRPE